MDASAYWRGCFLYDDFQNSHFPIITDHLFLSYHWFRRLFFLPCSIYLDQLVRGFFYYYFFLLYPWIFFSPTHPLVALYLVPNLSWFVTKFGFLPRCKKWFHLAANIWHRCQCTGHRSPAIKEGFAFELDGDWNRQQFYLLSSFSYAVFCGRHCTEFTYCLLGVSTSWFYYSLLYLRKNIQLAITILLNVWSVCSFWIFFSKIVIFKSVIFLFVKDIYI